MPDDMDFAQGVSEQFLADALRDHYERRQTGDSLTHCLDCGEPILERRRIAVLGCCRCYDCQRDFENSYKGKP